MEEIQNLVEYYDELFPITQEQKEFYKRIISKYKTPAKLLSMGCATGCFENYLSQQGCDVTGIESSPEMLRSASLKRRSQLMSVRFFQMKMGEAAKFLTKGFYDVIYSLNSRIIFSSDRDFLDKFFTDCRTILAPEGRVIIQLLNIEAFTGRPMVQLPCFQNVRVKLFTELWFQEDGSQTLVQNIETGNGKMLSVMQDEPVYIPGAMELQEAAKKAGFRKVSLFAGFDETPFTGKEESFIAVFS